MCEGEKEARERGQLLHGLQNPQGTETMKKKNQFDSNFQRKKGQMEERFGVELTRVASCFCPATFLILPMVARVGKSDNH
jgi:hypothetical protein